MATLQSNATVLACMYDKSMAIVQACQSDAGGIVAFYYLKSDGSVRKAHGTLKDMPSGATLGGKKITKPSYKTMSYYDTERKAFRSFKVENLICVI